MAAKADASMVRGALGVRDPANPGKTIEASAEMSAARATTRGSRTSVTTIPQPRDSWARQGCDWPTGAGLQVHDDRVAAWAGRRRARARSGQAGGPAGRPGPACARLGRPDHASRGNGGDPRIDDGGRAGNDRASRHGLDDSCARLGPGCDVPARRPPGGARAGRRRFGLRSGAAPGGRRPGPAARPGPAGTDRRDLGSAPAGDPGAADHGHRGMAQLPPSRPCPRHAGAGSARAARGAHGRGRAGAAVLRAHGARDRAAPRAAAPPDRGRGGEARAPR